VALGGGAPLRLVWAQPALERRSQTSEMLLYAAKTRITLRRLATKQQNCLVDLEQPASC